MSRIGKLPVQIPAKVKVTVTNRQVTVEGPKGTLSRALPPGVEAVVEGAVLLVKPIDDSRQASASWGLSRTLLQNMVTGVTTGFTRKMMIKGVGYRTEARGDRWLLFSLGYSHPILFELPTGVTATIDAKENSVTIAGIDREVIGQTAAEIRGLRPPEPYKGKGVRYDNEKLRQKEGKSKSK
jgi:large subunit ribosomal protein L6